MTPVRMNLGAIDLNLLLVFDAVMQERNVTRAGKRLGLSQPAMSHALARVRQMLNDELFVRSPNGMLPTPRAEELAPPLRKTLDDLQQALEPATFDPSANRTFRIAADNYAAIVLVAPLASRIAKNAPGVTLEFRPSGTIGVHDLLDRGELDLALGAFAKQGERFSRRELLQDSYVTLLRKNHPAANANKMTVENFAALPHLEISSVHPATNFVDDALSRRKLTRSITRRAPLLSAISILATSDCVAVVPKRIAEELVTYRPLTIGPLPHSSQTIETAMIWPRWFDTQPAHRWLRQNVEAAVNALPHERALIAQSRRGSRRRVNQ
jgi:DNA-binding transcriptional LysR family regulator